MRSRRITVIRIIIHYFLKLLDEYHGRGVATVAVTSLKLNLNSNPLALSEQLPVVEDVLVHPLPNQMKERGSVAHKKDYRSFCSTDYQIKLRK